MLISTGINRMDQSSSTLAMKGFMWEIAPIFKALVIFAEHRYYGKSMPYGKDSYKDPAHLQYFTSEQALADYAVFIRNITKDAGRNNPVIVFGGSYGGMLAAWFRMKYPHLVAGAIAASAPIWQFTGLTDCHMFNKIVTADYEGHSKACADNIRNTWAVINKNGATAQGRQFLTNTFKMCKTLSSTSDVEAFKAWLYEVYGNLAMINYPYATSFLEPVPAWPVIAACDQISRSSYSEADLMKALFKTVSIYFNYTGSAKCLNISQQASGSLSDNGWDFQACTEMAMPMCADGVTDMFEPSPWNFSAFSDDCYKSWKVRPQRDWVITHYADRDIRAASNIVFSNGQLDPWSGGGVLKTVNPSLPTPFIAEAAHHLDLRSSNPADPVSVRKVRLLEMANIRNWISYWKEEHSTVLYFKPT
ncbi:lysosomal Pro-X carboxypeptidase-like isoform X2 [Lineus longissimus]|uniref:lysosomal Pro-X carboxypeptidase-like isoform X2 n=1 Tax=Lineus longissimus TaxID=88925 RepID=UPI00315D2300